MQDEDRLLTLSLSEEAYKALTICCDLLINTKDIPNSKLSKSAAIFIYSGALYILKGQQTPFSQEQKDALYSIFSTEVEQLIQTLEGPYYNEN